MVDFAIKHNVDIKGHALVWHVTSPPFLEDMTDDEVRECVRRHIFTNMGYFKGRIKVWDVVNESLRMGPWWRMSLTGRWVRIILKYVLDGLVRLILRRF
jgi:GH35 family endo-1,4-beta-xylanase